MGEVSYLQTLLAVTMKMVANLASARPPEEGRPSSAPGGDDGQR
jgi:hypothetical protein